MKRFYLTLCFLMSIIGSAWGQETATGTLKLDVSEMGKNAVGDILTNGYSNEYISMSFSECQKYDYSIKINGWSDKVPLQFLTVTPNGNNVTITKVVLKGALDNNGNDQGKTIKVGDITLTAEKDEDNYSRTYEPTEGVSEPVVFVKEGGTSYMQSIEVTYTYTPVAATAISLNQTTAVLAVGGELTLNATVSPDNATDKSVTWSSNDTGIATVDANGNVTAVAAGTAYITATSNSDANVTATCTVVVPEVLSVGTTQKTATVANITSFNKCVITKSGQLMDSATDGATVTFQVTPEVSGTYSFTSIISTAWQERSVTLTCGDQTGEEKIITPGGWYANNGQSYTWEFDLIKDQTYTITVSTKEYATEIAEEKENGYMVDIYDMDIVMTAAAVTTNTVNAGINHFNYIDGTFPATRNNFLGLNFSFGGSAVVDGYMTVRLDNGGNMTIQSANSKNIRKVVFQKVSDERLYTVESLTSNVDGTFALDGENNLVWTATADATQVVFTSAADNTYIKNFDISVEDENTELYETKVTPTISFNNPTTTIEAGQTVENVAKVQVNYNNNDNFRVRYTSSNTDVATVGEYTGIVTAVGAGTATITASYNGARLKSDKGAYESAGSNAGYDAAESVTYNITVTEAAGDIECVENEGTSLFVEDFNYFNNTSVSNGLNRTGVRGFNLSFAGDAMSPKAIVTDGTYDYISLSSQQGTAVSMTVAIYDSTRDEDGNTVANAITNVKFICQGTPNTEGVVVTDQSGNTVEGTWGTNGNWYLWAATAGLNSTATSLTFTFPTGATGATLGFSRIDVGTTAKPIFRDNTHDGVKQKDMTPSMSFANASIRFEKGTQTEINNALTVKANDNVIENFKVTYTITDANGNAVANATADAQSGKVTLPADLAVGTYTVKAAFVVSTDRGNTLYKEAAGSYTINIFEYSTPYTIDGGTLTMNDITGAAYIREGQTASVTNLGIVFEGEDYTVTNGKYSVNNVNYDVAHAATNGITLNGNIPSEETGEGSGGYLVLTPAVNGTLSLNACYFDKQTITVVDSEGNIAGSYKHDGNKYNYYGTKDFVLRGGKTYYVYNNGGFSLQIRAISFAKIEETMTEFDISDFNYVTNKNSNRTDLDREVGGFKFVYGGGDGAKCTGENSMIFRTRGGVNGNVTITTSEYANNPLITKAEFTVSSMSNIDVLTKYYKVTDENGNLLTAKYENNVISVEAGGVKTIKFEKVTVSTEDTSRDADAAFTLSKITLYTDMPVTKEKITPKLYFASETVTTDLTKKIFDGNGNQTAQLLNVLNTTPNNFRATFRSSNTNVVTVETGTNSTGEIKLVGAGEAIITATFEGNDYYNAIESVTYVINVAAVDLTNGHTWNFQTNTTVAANDAAIENGVYTGCSEANGLVFDASVGSLEKKDGYLLMDKNGKAAVTIPGVKAGQIVTFNVESESNLTEHGIVCTSGNAELKSGVKSNLQGYFSFVVTEDGEVTFAESDGNGAMKIYSITVSKENPGAHPEVKFLDENDNEITNRPVQWVHVEDGTHNHYPLSTSTANNASVNYEIIKGSDIATIVNNEVVFSSTGHVVVRAYIEGSTGADGNDAIMHLQHRKNATVTWMQGETDITGQTIEGEKGTSFTMPRAIASVDGVQLYYRSSNELAATIDSDGNISFLGGGQSTVITAYHASSEDYIAAYASFTLNVISEISFQATPNVVKMNIGSTQGIYVIRPNGQSNDVQATSISVNGYAHTSDEAKAIFSTIEYGKYPAAVGPGLLTLKVENDEALVGERVQVVINENYVATDGATHIISTSVFIEITGADARNFSWVKKSGKMVKGTFIGLPALTGNASKNDNKVNKFGSSSKDKDYKTHTGVPVFTISDESKAVIGWDQLAEPNSIGKKDTLLVYAKEAGTVIIRATDANNENIYDEYTLEIVDLDDECQEIVDNMTFPYTWDFSRLADYSGLSNDVNYWKEDKDGTYISQIGFYNGSSNTSSYMGNRIYMNIYGTNDNGDMEPMSIFNGLKLRLGNSNPDSKIGKVRIRKTNKEGQAALNISGNTHAFLLPAVTTKPSAFKIFIKASGQGKINVGNTGPIEDGAIQITQTPTVYGFDVDASQDIYITVYDGVDIYWIAASTEQTHSTTVNGYPEGDSRRTAMATYTYGKALDYSLSKEVNPGLRTYIASEISKTGKKLNVKLTETTDALRDGEGVILRSDNAQAFYMIADAENEKEYTAPEYRVDNYLVGTVDETTIYREDQAEANAVNYILSLKYTTENLGGVYQDVKDFGFYKLYSASITSKAKRSYLQVPFGDEGYGQAGANPEEGTSAEALGIIFEDIDGETTGIIEVTTDSISGNIKGLDGYYNLNGVRINGKPTQKGIYILNGKKIVVR